MPLVGSLVRRRVQCRHDNKYDNKTARTAIIHTCCITGGITGSGRLVLSVGGNWEVGPKNRWEVGDEIGRRWDVGSKKCWEVRS